MGREVGTGKKFLVRNLQICAKRLCTGTCCQELDRTSLASHLHAGTILHIRVELPVAVNLFLCTGSDTEAAAVGH
jgi:hypothetical protein